MGCELQCWLKQFKGLGWVGIDLSFTVALWLYGGGLVRGLELKLNLVLNLELGF